MKDITITATIGTTTVTGALDINVAVSFINTIIIGGIEISRANIAPVAIRVAG